MKSRYINFFRGAFVAAAFVPAFAHGEIRVGNGGDAMAAEFIDLADETLEQIEKLSAANEINSLDAKLLVQVRERIKSTIVYTEDKTFVGDKEVDALNFPQDNKIVLNRNRWRSLLANLKGLKTLLMHEYISIAGGNDKVYQVSNFIARKIFNGGNQGELWLLKDLGDRRFTNPFLNPWLEVKGTFFMASAGPKLRYLQGGSVVDLFKVDLSRPFCRMMMGSNLPASAGNTVIKLSLFDAKKVEASDESSRVSLDFQKAALVESFVCGSGSATNVTVKDMLDALGNTMVFNHQGKGYAPNTCPVE